MNVTEFTIDRSKWARGKIRGATKRTGYSLRNVDGSQCCLGFYSAACGTPDSYLREHAFPSRLANVQAERKEPIAVPAWLTDGFGEAAIVPLNDDPFIPEDVREAGLVKEFAKHGVTVTFVDGAA